jgi:hypothetical protein
MRRAAVVVRPRTDDIPGMEPKGLRSGHIVALVGAVLALLSLFRPWYEVRIPDSVLQMFGSGGKLGSDPGLLGQLSRSVATALPSSIAASGWKELQGADLALCVGAVGVIAAVLAVAGAFGPGVRVDQRSAGSAIAVVGAVALAIVAVHIVHKPGAGSPMADAVHLRSGIWMALAGAAAMLAGGLMAASYEATPARSGATSSGGFARLEPELPPVFADGASVPPPPTAY